MDINSINRNRVDKSSKACPMPPSFTPSYYSSYSLSKSNWFNENRLLLYYLVCICIGLILLFIASFLPPAVIIQEISSTTRSYYSIQIYTILSSPIPFFIGVGVGLTAALLISLTELHSFRHRLGGATIFSLLYSVSFLIDMINCTRLSSILATLYGHISPIIMLPWLTSPYFLLLMGITVIVPLSLASITIVLVTAYFSELLFTSIRAPIHIDVKTRRTAVMIQGGERTTVLSVNHKGGYTRGLIRPSKWQCYDRDD